MAYEQLEQLNDRKSEKMALFLSAENFGGMVLVAGPIYLFSTQWPLLLRLVAIIGAASLGVSLTVRVGGLPLYSRILWHVQGIVWQSTGRRLVVLDNLVGTTRRTPHTLPLGARTGARILKRRKQDQLAVVTQRAPQRRPLLLGDISPTSVAPNGHHVTPIMVGGENTAEAE